VSPVDPTTPETREGRPGPRAAPRGEGLFSQPQLVLVTGGTGFVGSHLVEKLVRRGYRVRLLIRRTSSLRWLEGVPVEYAFGDVRDKASIAGACVGVRSVFHVGGLTKAQSDSEYHEVNGQGTRNLAEALAERGFPGGFFVHMSSLAAGGPAIAVERDPEPVRTESDPPTPITPYGKSKLQGEIALREVADSHGRFRHVILRPPAVYGPRDEDTLVLFRMIKQGFLPVPRTPVNRLSLIYVEDLVDAAIRAAEKAARGTYYVSDGEIYTFQEVGREIANLMDVEVRMLRAPRPLAMFAACGAELWGYLVGRAPVLSRAKVHDIWQPHWVCSPEKARREWGFDPAFPLSRGLSETLTWYRLNQWL
jgi:nucleoside-diphosphate-sugar epimerase